MRRPVLAAAALLAAAAFAPTVSTAGAQQPAARPAPASPRDTARGTVGGAQVMVDYGRPSLRGRAVFGEGSPLAPTGKVWRTGANAATTLVTSADLTIGGTRVPKGTYTLYTVPGTTSWTLAINKQTGQWGTQYDQGQDLARVPMTVRTVASPVEQFTIAVTGNALTMTWGTTQASVPVAVAK